MRVLIVVSETATRQQLETFFLGRRHEITACPEIHPAREALSRGVFSLALVDLEPETEGPLALCREIRGLPPERRPFVLALTPAESPEAVRPALEAGADDYLAKPIQPAALKLRLAVGQRYLSTRRRTARTARGGEQRFRTLLETMREGVFVVDAEGRIGLANSRLSRITGFTADELIGAAADEILVTPTVRRRLPGKTLLGSGTGSEEYTLPLATKSGEPIWVELTAAPMPGTAGGSLGVVQDITAQRNAEESLRYREEYFRVLLENASDLLSILDLDGRILYQSRSSARLLGRDDETLLGRRFHDLLHEADRGRFSETLQRTLHQAGSTASVNVRLLAQDGGWRHFEALAKNLIEHPVVGGLLVTSRDVTERRRVEAALDRERALFQQLFRNSPAGIVILDDEDRVVDSNRAFLDLFKLDAGGIKGRLLSDLIVPETLKEEATQLSQLVFGRRTIQHETVRQRRDGSQVEVSIQGYPIELAEGRTGAFGLYTDISERKRAERQLFHEAFHDGLTGLPNRTLLLERLERDLRRTKRRADYRFALLFLDLDRFKEVNDSLGHAAGDAVLAETARRLEGCLRPGDTTARLAGDEFTLLLEDVKGLADATRIAERVLQTLRQPVELGGQSVAVSGSLGLVISSPSYARADELLRDADIAMYRAKSKGRSRYEIFDEELQRSAVERRRLETKLADAIEAEQQVLYYQPVVSLATGRIVGFEALVRWRHPERGLLGPDELIPACEATGLILPLGRWILERAFSQAVEWQRRFADHDGLRLSINLSEEQLNAADFFADLDAEIKASGVQEATVGFELRESLLVDAPESMPLLWRLRRRGFRIQIDGFGAGYTSLKELYRSPVEALKIDRSFIARMKPGGEDAEVVRAVSALGDGLGLSVVAEGIETQGQLDLARRLGPTHAQGFLFAKALPADEATALIAENPKW